MLKCAFFCSLCRMNGVESLSVRYHFRGVLEHDGKDWHYIGGRSGWSTVSICRLSPEEMKRHLADHISISDEDLKNTTFACLCDGHRDTLLASFCDSKLFCVTETKMLCLCVTILCEFMKVIHIFLLFFLQLSKF
jgi:hypothetical protein